MKKVMLVDPDDFFTGGRSRTNNYSFDEQKIYKKWKKFLKKEEEEAKKEDPKGWWAKKTIGERTCIIAILGPPAGIAYVFGLLQLAKLLAASAGIH